MTTELRRLAGRVRHRQHALSSSRWVKLAIGLAPLMLLMGCEEPPTFPNRQEVQGVVTMDGKPLPKALISFIPIGDTKGPKTSGEVREGKFHIDAERGPCPGEYQVKIETISPEIEALASRDMEALHRAAKEKGPPNVAQEFNVNSKLTATVREGGANRFEYAVRSAR